MKHILYIPTGCMFLFISQTPGDYYRGIPSWSAEEYIKHFPKQGPIEKLIQNIINFEYLLSLYHNCGIHCDEKNLPKLTREEFEVIDV